VTKFHLEMPLYTTTFALVFNKAKYDAMDAKQKKVIDDHCTSQWALRVAGPWADFEHNGIAKIKAEPGQDVYTINAEQVAEWRKATAPLEAKWAEGAKKAGVDPVAAMAELKADLKKENAAY
jgi:TRAP-type C4-dicarboxylate transport system substrate-binding protein